MAVVVAGTIQGKAGKPGKAGKAGKTGPGQTKPRLGTTGKPAKQFRAENYPRNRAGQPASTAFLHVFSMKIVKNNIKIKE